MAVLECGVEEILNKKVSISPFSFGTLNPEKKFYVIWRRSPGGGFFSNVFHVLGHTLRAEQLGMIPVVDMENFKTYYSEELPINNSKNAWEYYYKPLSNVSLDEVYQSKNVFFCDGFFNHQIYIDMQKYRHLIDTHLILQENIICKIREFKENNFLSNNVLGVHFRGQEMKRAIEHPTPPTKIQIKNAIDSMLNKHAIDKIFVATEEQSYLDFLIDQYQDKIIYTDYFRTYGDNAYTLKKHPRDRHMYKLGEEVLVDTYLLSCTKYLIAGGKNIADGSNVSRMAQFLSDGYEDMSLIYNGVNKDYIRYVNKIYKTYSYLKQMVMR